MRGAILRRARLYISGLGLYECYLNGCRVGEDVLAPTATDYTKTVCYNVYDVTDLLDEGVNTIGVILGNGRFFSMRTVTYTIPFTQVTIPGVRNYGYPKLLPSSKLRTARVTGRSSRATKAGSSRPTARSSPTTSTTARRTTPVSKCRAGAATATTTRRGAMPEASRLPKAG